MKRDSARAGGTRCHPARRWAAVALLTLAALLASCGTDSSVHAYADVEELPDGSRWVLGIEWTYRSFDVDGDLRVETVEDDASCATWAWLRVDKANAAEQRYAMRGLPCETMRIDSAGDILLDDTPTGVDWSAQKLHVDQDNDVLWLGPATPSDGAEELRFQVAMEPCADDTACECGMLRRLWGEEVRSLELSRRCP